LIRRAPCGAEKSRSGCKEKPTRREWKKGEKTRDFMVNLRETLFISARFRSVLARFRHCNR
jgi:hypothetical protein